MSISTPILALDVSTGADAVALVRRFRPWFAWAKVGMELFYAEGPQIVQQVRDEGVDLFLDLKLHDIPNTVEGAARSVSRLGASLLTVHAGGGAPMMQAAKQGAPDATVVAVTVLTSIDDQVCSDLWSRNVSGQVEAYVTAAKGAVDGVVCSVSDVASVRQIWSDAQVVTPGVRLAGAAVDDQARPATPADAAQAGSNFVVIGRTVTAAVDPEAAAARVVEELSSQNV